MGRAILVHLCQWSCIYSLNANIPLLHCGNSLLTYEGHRYLTVLFQS